MEKRVKFLVPLLLLLCCTISCHRGGRIIPPAEFSDIYAEMFVADQWIKDNPAVRRDADTSDVYGPVFKRYGYSFKDYDASLKHYLGRPEKFADITTNAAKKLEDLHRAFRSEAAYHEALRKFEASLPPYIRIDFDRDTVLRLSLLWDSADRAEDVADSLAQDAGEPADSSVSLVLSEKQLDSNVTRRNGIRTDIQPEIR